MTARAVGKAMGKVRKARPWGPWEAVLTDGRAIEIVDLMFDFFETKAVLSTDGPDIRVPLEQIKAIRVPRRRKAATA